MNLFKGLEKFGLKTEGTENLFEEEKRTNTAKRNNERKTGSQTETDPMGETVIKRRIRQKAG